jgi:hypothetical protein
MQRVTNMIICIVLTGSVTAQQLIRKSGQKQLASPRVSIEEVKKRPDLGVDYGRVSRFKLASRKATYRVGEMIGIDIAILNSSDAPFFIHKLERPTLELTAQDRNGAPVSINAYYTVLEGVAPDSYERVEPDRILSGTFYLLAGCDDGGLKAYFQARHNLEEEEHRGGGEAVFFKGLFERDLFVNWGEACLDIKKPGKYAIIAEQQNDAVVVSGSKVRTAVGKIRSAPLTLTITD